MNTELITTAKAAEMLGMTHIALQQWVVRNPGFRPNTMIGHAFLWTESEIEAVAKKRIQYRSRKRTSSEE